MESKIDPNSDITEALGMHHSPMSSRRLKRYFAIALVVIVAVTAVIIWKNGSKTTAPQYKTEQVKRANLTVIVTATGTLKATK